MFNKIKYIVYLLSAMLLVMAGCTDLTDTVEDGIGEESVDGGAAPIDNPTSALVGVYSQLNNLRGAGETFALMEHTSDEMMGPTRGTDWSDFGVWRQLHAHTWDPSHGQLLNAWNQLNSGVYRATQVIEASSASAQEVAEARFLRAYFMYYIMDFYGQVPFREPDAAADDIPSVYSRSEAFEFIIDDLTAARDALPNLSSGADAGQASQESVDFLMARLYLNKAVYLGSDAENPSAGPYTFENGDMDEVISRTQNIIDNPYTELTSYFDNFHWNNTNLSNELIFVIPEEEGGGSSFNHFYMTLHYNNSPSGCCNGFTTLGSFYNKFEDSDVRKGQYIPGMSQNGVLAGFLEGQQYGSFDGSIDNPGEPLNDRGGNPLVFTPEVDLFYSNERMGIRVIKYLIYYENPERPATDFVLFRYGDALLMKAEAHFRKGETGQALSIINDLREQRGASQLSNLDEQTILDERGRELYWEGWRRQDLVRFGAYTNEWEEKPASEGYRVLFPIPQRALDTNPNLVQNSGY
ncbi:RagB/SusD family nutrient uptake outer membrane protein [Rhodohalobacter sp. 614A]|uniref:RagB/SusD family nutrient uptake outer membrane protein n=1 Tax=Rhodohalobacter sp. 614A TaxID=2908649 RepID=UPI001F1C437A|nr:RagB/SusD family nutrient uptake outer membrane protein [Rhodohalobacter sp. 614A]